jgi:hypothetical protein
MTGVARRRSSRAAAVLVAAFAVVAAAWAPAQAVAATEFGTPTARSTFGREIVFRQPLTIDDGVRRVEILIETPGSIGPYITPVAFDAVPGRTTLTHRIETGEGGVSPNTTFSARWRVVRDDGTSDLGPAVSVTYDDTRFDWRTVSGEIVRVHWYEGSDAFGRRALAIGEQAVEETAALLGVTESEPVDFFVYADQDAFYDALGPDSRENVGGRAITETRTMFALITPDAIDDAWVGIVIPHELIHLVFDTTVANPYHYPLHWLNEGLAVYLSEGYSASDRDQVEAAARDGTLIPLDGLVGQFPTSRDRFFLAYAESASAVDFLIRTYGDDALVDLVRSYAGGVSDDEAFMAALGVDVAAFDAAWRAGLDAVEPVAYGPQPAPPGPLPPGWEGSPADGSPKPGSPTASAAASVPPGSAPSTGGGGPSVGLLLAVAALVVGAAGVALLVVDRRRRPSVTGAAVATGDGAFPSTPPLEPPAPPGPLEPRPPEPDA